MFYTKLNNTFLLSLLIFIFLINILYAKPIKYEGLKRLSLDDIQAITDYQLDDNNFTNKSVNEIIKSFLNSNLFYDIELIEDNEYFLLKFTENYLIKNIYINNNVRLEDESLLSVISSKSETFLDKNLILKDIKSLKNSYLSIGFKDISISSKIENLNDSHVNLIFDIKENNPFKIRYVNFIGNIHFSERYLRGIINSKPVKSFNFFTTGSNFNEALIQFDLNKLKNLYTESGYNNAKINYTLSKYNNDYVLKFIIEENDRSKVNNITIENPSEDKEFNNYLNLTLEKLKSEISKNNNFYDKSKFDKFLKRLNKKLVAYNFDEIIYKYKLSSNDMNSIDVSYLLNKSEKFVINRITIYGNSITKDKTIRSRLSFQPGDIIYSKDFVDENKKTLNKERFINSSNIVLSNLNDNKVDVDIEITENKKTGNLFIAGGYDQDLGVGFSLGLSDDNILGSGNKIDSSLGFSSDSILFDIGITQKPLFNPSLTFRYNIFNNENDYKDSFGYKSKTLGLGLGIKSFLNKNISNNISFKLSSNENYDSKNSGLSVTDNIGKFNKFSLTYNISNNTLNNEIYPTQGTLNSLDIEVAPEFFSDINYYRISLKNNFYIKQKNSDSNFFALSSVDIVDTLNGERLKTIDSLSLGGRNFKGFDFRGIGSKDNFSNYLGGKKRYTLSIGHTSTFLFDKKDNILFSNYFSVGSLWDNDYKKDDHKLRASFTTAFDILTPIGPLTLSYSIPLEKEQNDKTNNVSFSIGTTF
tara:strand:+ start:821 stop:3085 length:2265 start_codon:yes stop_codon:yes gene_type:complete